MATADANAETDWSPSRLAFVWVVFRKQLVLLVRYPLNTATRFLTLAALFGIIFFGGQAVAGPTITDSLGGIIVGLFIWTLAIVAFSQLAWDVTREAQWGTLERLFLSPHGFGTVMVTKTVVNVLMSFLWAFALLVVMMAVSGEWLSVDPLTVLPLGVLTVASISGVGFLFAGLALLYKRIENVFQLVQWAFVALIAAPVGANPLLKLLPVSHGSYLLRRAMDDGVRLWEFAPSELAILVATSVAYLFAGYYCLYRAQRRARQNGVLGQY
ncbi:ABC-2 type transport system permease protein [Halovenus aranensis]|jgi:ABC-2 type transport system permease protein|uniref:ABC-2 type transport system permease protein n=1 Tax=Halovenus aranensis TaxID=890420 RepID=A0A1G8V280_9EURY|nr:ABC transporter permease [Halovenus aranensis]SDJ59260.1 ABC-2 type transport system permease protein [Halovenus aranensis]